MKGLKKYIIWTVLTFCIVLGMSIPMKTHAVTSGDYSYTYVYEYEYMERSSHVSIQTG